MTLGLDLFRFWFSQELEMPSLWYLSCCSMKEIIVCSGHLWALLSSTLGDSKLRRSEVFRAGYEAKRRVPSPSANLGSCFQKG